MNLKWGLRCAISIVSGLVVVAGAAFLVVAAIQIDIPGPAGSEEFGRYVTVLPNGNLLVRDPLYNLGGVVGVGAVYLYDGATGMLISKLTGSTVGDYVGGKPVTVLSNGNFVISSPDWDNGVVVNAGAATWGSATTGITGTISVTNSLVGSAAYDGVGTGELWALSNGNYLVSSTFWNNSAGAVTWGDGSNGITGTVSVSNSLVGSTAFDQVGEVMTLPNGNYVVFSFGWDNGAAIDAGAVTWGSGTTGITGTVSVANSLVGSTTGDRIGYPVYGGRVTPLSNGNFIVRSPEWDNGAAVDAGAMTWVNGATGITGVVSASNSLVGSTAGDNAGKSYVVELPNGNFVIVSPDWDNGAAVDAGAVTWGSGAAGITGAISAASSLVGSKSGDQVGGRYNSVRVLTNANYVVESPAWDNGPVADAGAITWGSGVSGVTGEVSVSNSLVGSSQQDWMGSVTVLPNGNYVVGCAEWDNGAIVNAGSVTWADGSTGITGTVSATNSLVGSAANDYVGAYKGVVALPNSNYLLLSLYWDNGSAVDAGAVTWGDGITGTAGVISPANSLVGSASGDNLGHYTSLRVLANSSYVLRNFYWDNGAAVDAGAVTWGSGTAPITGAISASNSLVGGTTGDQIGSSGLVELYNGNFVVASRLWDNGAAVDAGAVTWGSGTTGVVGVVSASNSLVGSTSGDQVGDLSEEVKTLNNGNYAVESPYWDNGAVIDAGAVTWGDGMTGVTGPVSASNSLVGSSKDDWLGSVTVLNNGNYVVGCAEWDNGAIVNAGAVTWADGNTGITGTISAMNSLVGGSAYDYIGEYKGVRVLANGDYAVLGRHWDNGAAVDAGSVTLADGMAGIRGVVSPLNSLVGSTSGDSLGVIERFAELPNGAYILLNPQWDNGTAVDAGALTRFSRTGGAAGPISASNSLVGTSAGDQIGFHWLYLPNGNFVVLSPYWDNTGAADAGAVTWVSGTAGIAGAVSAANSLVGSTVADHIGGLNYNSYVLSNGNYVVLSPEWDNGAAVNAGAVTLGDGSTGATRGAISAANSVCGIASGGGREMNHVFDEINDQLVVGRPYDVMVTLIRLMPLSFHQHLPLIIRP